MTECVCGHDESWHEGVCNHGKHAARCPCKQFRPAGPIVIVDRVVEAVRADLLKRSQAGIAKYGVSLERTDLSLRDWLQHAYEECLDQANYLKRCIVTIDEGKK
jgi:hypothetical protein